MKTKHTQGNWSYSQDGDSYVVSTNGKCICSTNEIEVTDGNMSMKEVKANAKLIAEAGTVANETGLTPRQLLEQRNELLEALNKALEFQYLIRAMELSRNLNKIRLELRNKIENAIKKCT